MLVVEDDVLNACAVFYLKHAGVLFYTVLK